MNAIIICRQESWAGAHTDIVGTVTLEEQWTVRHTLFVQQIRRARGDADALVLASNQLDVEVAAARADACQLVGNDGLVHLLRTLVLTAHAGLVAKGGASRDTCERVVVRLVRGTRHHTIISIDELGRWWTARDTLLGAVDIKRLARTLADLNLLARDVL